MVASRRPQRRRRLRLPVRIERFDERVAARINARRTSPGADASWRSLTRFANHGKLWFVVAAALALTGRYRAAARALVSLGVASAVANLVGKRIVGGDRPALTAIPIARRLRRSPTSGSFPSGHTASAAAFAAGVALESPKAGAVVAPLAAAVGYSRLHTGAHWFSDVAGGALIGVGVATIGKLLLPVSPASKRNGRTAGPTGSNIRLPALPNGEGVLLLVNPRSGRGLGRANPVPRLRERLPLAVIHQLEDGDDLPSLTDAALASGKPPKVLGVYGGDGTVSAVAGVARRHGLPLLAMPGGTFNHFARAAGLETVELAIDALNRGTGRAVDVGELSFGEPTSERGAGTGGGDSITVLNTASVGLYPAFVDEREKNERKLGKPLAAVIAAVRAVRRSTPFELEVNGEHLRAWSIFAGIGRYYPTTVAPIERPRLDDGLLDVRILRADRQPRTRGAVALVLGGRVDAMLARLPLVPGPPAVHGFTTGELTLALPSDDPSDPGFAHDGEATRETPARPLRLRLVKGGLQVYSPVTSTEAATFRR